MSGEIGRTPPPIRVINVAQLRGQLASNNPLQTSRDNNTRNPSFLDSLLFTALQDTNTNRQTDVNNSDRFG